MSYEQKEGCGALFLNDKGDNPKRPDFRGDLLLKGNFWELSAWRKTDRNGKTYLSISARLKQEELLKEEDVPF